MADNTRLGTNVGTGDLVLTFETSFSGDSVKFQGVGLLGVSGTNDAWAGQPINGTSANGIYTDVRVIQAGANVIGDVGMATRTSGGPTPYRNTNVGVTGVNIKTSAGQLFWLHAMNQHTAPLYLRLYNKASAPVAGDTTLIHHTFVIPSQGTANAAGFVLVLPFGIPFSSGIGLRCTTGIGDSDTGAPAGNACVVNAGYK